MSFKNVPTHFIASFEKHKDDLALRWKERNTELFQELTYGQFYEKIEYLAVALINLGLKRQDKVALIADISCECTIADMALQFNGAVSVPRGTDSTKQDLGYIVSHSRAQIAFVHYPSEIDKIEEGLEGYDHKVEKFIVLNNYVSERHADRAFGFNDLIEKGHQLIEQEREKYLTELERRQKETGAEDLSTIVYTSGTTGLPKGAMLTHSNIDFTLQSFSKYVPLDSNDRTINLLPPWHIFGRAIEYITLLSGATMIYTDTRRLAQDLIDTRPTFLPAVPRVWQLLYDRFYQHLKNAGQEQNFIKYRHYLIKYYRSKNALLNRQNLFAPIGLGKRVWHRFEGLIGVVVHYIPRKLGDFFVFRKIKDALGGELRLGVVGASATAYYLDEFFQAIGINLLEGYGMTETSAIISIRDRNCNIPGALGRHIDETEIKLIDETGRDVTNIPGAKGTLHTRGPHVMKGYYNNPELTRKVLDKGGWMNTGDVAALTTDKRICILGRSKDTIVLSNGENLEPTPIEEKLKESDYIDHVMIVGQDQKYLGALIVPNEKELSDHVRKVGIRGSSLSGWLEESAVKALYKKEISHLVNEQNGFKVFEHIIDFRLLDKEFEKGDELSNTMKLRRHIVTEKYQDLIQQIFRDKKASSKAAVH